VKLLSVRSLAIFLPLALLAQVGREGRSVPLHNWSAPHQLQRSQLAGAMQHVSQLQAAGKPELQLAGSAANDTLVFVPLTPCRLADTRSGSGYPALGSTPLSSLTPRNLPIAGACGAPSQNAPFPGGEAYSLNVTVVPAAATTGGYLVVYPNPSSPVPLAASLTWNPGALYQTAAVIVAASSDGSVNLAANFTTDVVVDINGYYAPPTDLNGNTGMGLDALGPQNTGSLNTAFGAFALVGNTTGQANTAVGVSALELNTTGSDNTAVGEYALRSNSSVWNTAVGAGALQANTAGLQNTAVGYLALAASQGDSTIAIGYTAGNNVTGGENSIFIGNNGVASDTQVIRIGDGQGATYISGISGVNVTGGATVVVNSNGQLGVETSSRQYKEAIQDMGEASSGLLRLRPVTFQYKQANADGVKPLEYGLIAEEVNKVYPELVIRGRDGQIETVQYQKLPVLLLNELQKQSATIHTQAGELAEEREQNRKLEARLAALEALVARAASGTAADKSLQAPAGDR
jgi:hypothetical protein